MSNASPARKILHAVISLEVSKGHLKWKVSDLARKVGVSRPLIYYHFGKSKREILEKTVVMVAEDYFGLTPDRVEMLQAGRAVESLLLSRKLFLANPAFAVFYLKWRMEKSPLQSKLLEVERRYQQMLSRQFPGLTKGEITALHGIFYGVVTAPFLDEAAIKTIIRVTSRI
jgi:AcrR family transcriptional regulator